MIIQDESKLKAWISHLVEDISDAEPDALAKYVIALVKKPHSEADLEKLCSEKLSVFLQTHTEDFVVQLFAALKSGTYLTQTSSGGLKMEKQDEPEQDQKPEDLATTETDELVLTDPEPESEHELEEQSPTEKTPPKKMTTPSKSKDMAQAKRETKPSPRIESSRPSKEDSRKLAPESFRKLAPTSPAPVAKPIRKRISPPRATSAERRAERRQSPLRRRVIVGNVGGAGGGLRVQGRHHRDARRAHSKSRSRSPHIRKEKRPDLDARRRRCRDFHEKGYCMRGDGCPYDHGPDPVVVEDSALEKMVRTGTVFDPATTYGVNPPPPGIESAGSIKALSNITEGYNPEAPALTTPSVTVTCIDFSVPPPPIPQMVQRAQLIFPPGTAPPTSILPPYTGTTMTLPVQTTSIYGANPTGQINTFGSTGNGMMMRGGRYKPYSLANRNPASRSLLVKKVPPEMNKIAQLDQHFSKFGQVTNVQVQYEGRSDTALVTFKTRRDAMMAYKSTEPIFNNRFIKVFWQNDTQAQTADGEGAPAEGTTNAGIVAESGPTIPLSTGPVGKSPRIMPRCFTKTFAKPIASVLAIQQPSSDPNTDETVPKAEPTTAETMPTTTTDAATSSSSSSGSIQPTSTAPPILPQTQARPMYGSPRAMAMKRKNDKEKLGKLMELHKMKADLYAKLVDQQKMLLQKLKNTEDKEQKKKLMEFLKKAEGPAKKAKAELEELGAKIREAQQRQQTTGPKKRRMSLITGQPSASSNDNGQQTENGAAISSPKTNSPNKKLFKLCRVVYVSNCPPEHSEKLIIHMEKFGDLFDYDINMEPHMFTYKNPVDAQKAVADAVGSFAHAKLQVEWAPTAKNVKSEAPVIPDRERKPSEQITPKDLLASLDYDEDEEEGENAPKEEESEEAGEEE